MVLAREKERLDEATEEAASSVQVLGEVRVLSYYSALMPCNDAEADQPRSCEHSPPVALEALTSVACSSYCGCCHEAWALSWTPVCLVAPLQGRAGNRMKPCCR